MKPASSALQLENVFGLRLGSALLVPDMIERLAKRPQSLILAGVGSSETEDFLVMSYIVAQRLPLKIRTSTPTVLLCQLARFPFEIDDESGYEEFAMRIFPHDGKIMSVEFLTGADTEIAPMEVTPERLFLEASNSLFEIYYSIQDVHSLPALRPAPGFVSRVSTNRT